MKHPLFTLHQAAGLYQTTVAADNVNSFRPLWREVVGKVSELHIAQVPQWVILLFRVLQYFAGNLFQVINQINHERSVKQGTLNAGSTQL